MEMQMSFRLNQYEQKSFIPMLFFNENAFQELENSWAGYFANEIFPYIDESLFEPLFSDNPASRPNTPVNMLVSYLILKTYYRFTDEEFINAVKWDLRIAYATRSMDLSRQPINQHSLRRFRNRILEYEKTTGIDLLKVCLLRCADSIGKLLGVKITNKRMDSLMIASGCKRLSRLDLMHTVIKKMIKQIKNDKKIKLDKIKFKEYINDDDNNITYRLHDNQVMPQLEREFRKAIELSKLLGNTEYVNTEEYKDLIRTIDDQGKTDEKGNIILRNGKEISSTSLQNPSDRDATYRKKGKKGHVGFVANVVETCSPFKEEGKDKAKEVKVNIITDYDLQKNTYSDAQFANDTLDKMPDSDEIIYTLNTDGSYVSIDIIEHAKRKGVEIVCSTLTGKETDEAFGEFKIEENTNLIVKCPMGNIPLESKYNEKTESYIAYFEPTTCKECSYCSRCKITMSKKKCKVVFSTKMRMRSILTKRNKDKEYKKRSNIRNGVEGIPSVIRRAYDIDRWGVRGLQRANLQFGTIIAAMNFRTLVKARQKAKKLAKTNRASTVV